MKENSMSEAMEEKAGAEAPETGVKAADAGQEDMPGTEKQEKKLREDKFKRLFPKPPKLYMNSINKLIRQMKDADIPCVTSSGAVDGYYEYIIRFPMAE